MMSGNNSVPVISSTTLYHSDGALYSTTTSVTTDGSRRDDAYCTIWQQWENNTPPGSGELRDMAVRRLQACLQQQSVSLDLSGMNLSTLPPLLPVVSELNVSNNVLTELPAELPDGLIYLSAADNRLTALPRQLPPFLQLVNLADNQLTQLPEAIMTLGEGCMVHMNNNPLSEQAILFLVRQPMNGDGPRINFPTLHDRYVEMINPLVATVAEWFPAESEINLAEKWTPVSREVNAGEFTAFLKRLGETESTKKNLAFKEQVAEWLNSLVDSPALREKIFAVASGATESCEDRVSYTWNSMQQATLMHRVEHGEYDDKVSELVCAGREMFRLQQLEQVFWQKVKNRQFADEVEIWLALQNKLRESLALSLGVPQMRFAESSYLTGDLLEAAETTVKKMENENFPGWFAQWAPWHKALARIDPAGWEQATERQYQALDGDYQRRIEAELAASGLPHDVDTEREIGKKVIDEINREIFTSLTRKVIADHHLEPLITWQWKR